MTPRPVQLLFICIGNTCRSPLAAGMAAVILGARVHAESAGITATGCPAMPDAIAAMQEHFGIDLTAHRSRHLTEVALAQFDVLIALDPIVYASLHAQRTVPPPQLLLWPLNNPYRKGLDTYRQCLAQVQAAIEAHATVPGVRQATGPETTRMKARGNYRRVRRLSPIGPVSSNGPDMYGGLSSPDPPATPQDRGNFAVRSRCGGPKTAGGVGRANHL